MSGDTDALGGRLPLADPAALSPAQREIFDRMAQVIVPWANEARFQSTAEDGRLIGPFNPALLNPASPHRFWTCSSPNRCIRR
jgi:4-carboxymuconolactone decarboxylase